VGFVFGGRSSLVLWLLSRTADVFEEVRVIGQWMWVSCRTDRVVVKRGCAKYPERTYARLWGEAFPEKDT
jgi:hypothetical protein